MDTKGNGDSGQTDQKATCETGLCRRTPFGGLRLCQILIIILFIIMAVTSARGQVVQKSPDFTEKINVVEHLGETIEVDLPVIDARGDTVSLASQFDGETPVLMVLHYSDCPMLCGLVLDGVATVVEQMEYVPGDQYRILTISVDPLETPQRTAGTQARYRKRMPEGADPEGWNFFTAPEATLEKLTDQVGFVYYYDEEKKEYMHPAVITVLSGEGMISRYLYGIEFKPRDMRLAMLEASEGKVGNTVDRLLLYCFHYDPDAEGYVVFAGNVMRLGGAVTLVLMGIVLGGFWLRERKRGALRDD